MRGFFGCFSEKKRREGTKEEEKKGDFNQRYVRERRSIITLSVFEPRGWTTSRPQGKKTKQA